jgi:hypothetical protein
MKALPAAARAGQSEIKNLPGNDEQAGCSINRFLQEACRHLVRREHCHRPSGSGGSVEEVDRFRLILSKLCQANFKSNPSGTFHSYNLRLTLHYVRNPRFFPFGVLARASGQLSGAIVG